jgi:hypothetical protein
MRTATSWSPVPRFRFACAGHGREVAVYQPLTAMLMM